MVNYKGGTTGIYWSSQIAAGHDNDLSIRVYGSKGSLIWRQEDPNYLKVSYLDKPSQILSRGRDAFYPRPTEISRTPAGHPEGYFEAFATIYTTFINALAKKKVSEVLSDYDLDFPTPVDGVSGVKFIEKCVESSEKGAIWIKF